jgi:hypothetical protein
MAKWPTIFVTLSDDNASIVARWEEGTTDKSEVIRSLDDLSNLSARLTRRRRLDLDQVHITCSSSLDFAAEFASDPDVIALAKELRS